MKLFESNNIILKRSSHAKPSKRFVCWVVDLILVTLCAVLVFTGLLPIIQNTSYYKEAEQTLNQEIDYYEDLIGQTHIVEFVDGERVANEVIVFKNVCRAICLSYEVFGNAQQPDFKFDENHDVMLNGVHSVENDNIAYFYIKYLKENTSMNIDATSDLFEIYKTTFGEEESLMFSFNREVSEMPVLKTEPAYELFHYLFIDESDSIGKKGAEHYEVYYNAYVNMLEKAELLVLESEPYNSTHYQSYKEAYSAEATYVNITLVVSIFISCFIVLLIPKYLFKDEKTVGYKLFGLGVVRTDGKANKWYVPLIKTIIDCFGYIPISIIMYLFAPFNASYRPMFTPVNPSSSISLGWVVLVILFISGIVNAFCLFTNRKQNLLNLIFNDLVVDVNRPYEDEHISKNQGRSY